MAWGSSTPPKNTKFESDCGGRAARAGELVDEPVALGLDVARPSASISSTCAQRRDAAAWVTRREVVGQPDQAQRVGDLGVGGQVAERGRRRRRTPCSWCGRPPGARGPGSRVSALRGAGRARTRRRPRRRRRCRWLAGLVDGLDRRPGPAAVPVGLFGRAEEDDVGPVLARPAAAASPAVRLEVLGADAGDVPGVRCRRPAAGTSSRWAGSPCTRAARAAEGLQDLLQHLVGAVGGPDVLARSRPWPR